MNQTTLVIMAAGIGSRYGAGIKQLQKVGPTGEIIIDYSIHDALEAGFSKIIFVIRKDIEEDFKTVIGSRIEQYCPVEYVFQDINDLPDNYICPLDRTKPWGTGHAILACRNVIDTPFAIINADDYYGKEAFVKMHNFLINHTDTKTEYCMIGFKLSNTLSENGTVTRGVCSMNNEHYLSRITETHEILKASDGLYESEEGIDLNDDTLVSMNMWGVTPEYIDILQDKFAYFLSNLSPSDTKSEFLLPTIMGDLLDEDSITVKVLDSSDKWFGVTYTEDKDSVINAFNELISKGIYSTSLWSDIQKR